MSHVTVVLWLGLAIGLIFGACGQATGFCLHRGLKEYWSGENGFKLQAFALALAVAIIGTQGLEMLGLVELDKSLYRVSTYSWLLIPLGGLMFGYGMGLANGCGARALVLLGQGNLRSLVVLLCLGIAAYMTLSGLIAPLRVALANITSITPSSLTLPPGNARVVVTVVVAAALLWFALRSGHREGRRANDLTGGAIVGMLVVAGWFVTGNLGNDDFEPLPVASLTFVAPIGDVIQYAMIATGMSLRFGITVVVGVIAGALLTALLRRKYRLEGFESPRHMLRYIAGGSLMGAGGALALGCSIGQGLTGLSTLTYSSMLASLAIVAGARLAWRRHPSRARTAVAAH